MNVRPIAIPCKGRHFQYTVMNLKTHISNKV